MKAFSFVFPGQEIQPLTWCTIDSCGNCVCVCFYMYDIYSIHFCSTHELFQVYGSCISVPGILLNWRNLTVLKDQCVIYISVSFKCLTCKKSESLAYWLTVKAVRCEQMSIFLGRWLLSFCSVIIYCR